MESIKPSEFVKKHEQISDNSNSFLKFLIQKYKQQKQERLVTSKEHQPKSSNNSPVQEHSNLVNQNEAPKKSTELTTPTNKSNSSSSTSNKNSKLISQIIEANATKAIQQQHHHQQQQQHHHQTVSPQTNSPPVAPNQQQIVQSKTTLQTYSIQNDLVSAQLASNGNIVLENSSGKRFLFLL